MHFVCGDTHGTRDYYKLLDMAQNIPDLSLQDKLFIAGDWGVLWNFSDEAVKEEGKLLEFYKKLNMTVLVVPGNHENYTRINSLPEIEMFGAKAKVVAENIYILNRGEVYTIDERKYFVMGGGLSIDKGTRIPYHTWWPEELPSSSEEAYGMKRLAENNFEVDYVITHDCPESIYEILHDEDSNYYKDTYNLPRYLEMIRHGIKYKRWFCGHHHQDRDFPSQHVEMLYNVVKLIC